MPSEFPTPAQSPLDQLATEQVRPGLDDLDLRPIADVVRVLIEGQAAAQRAAAAALPQLAIVAQGAAARLAGGGRLIYAGAGTSGRLAVLDAAECMPTFSAPPGLVTALLAGGDAAFVTAIEGAEDDAAAGAHDVDRQRVGRLDAVIGIAASGRTPYAVGAVARARQLGAYTAAIVNNPGSRLADTAEDAIVLATGPEIIAGSTRLAAGTAQKIALNTLSTAVMVHLGKTFGPWMIDMRATNAKLRRRAVRIVHGVTGAGEAAAADALTATDGQVKAAVVMLMCDCDADAARRRLAAADGRVRGAIADS